MDLVGWVSGFVGGMGGINITGNQCVPFDSSQISNEIRMLVAINITSAYSL